jgi:hypothetical protein
MRAHPDTGDGFRYVAGPATRPSLLFWQLAWSKGKRAVTAARRGERPRCQSVSPAVAEMVGWRRDRTASMISEGSMPYR